MSKIIHPFEGVNLSVDLGSSKNIISISNGEYPVFEVSLEGEVLYYEKGELKKVKGCKSLAKRFAAALLIMATLAQEQFKKNKEEADKQIDELSKKDIT